MDRRRLTALLALVIIIAAVAWGTYYYQTHQAAEESATTAFPPAQSADESTPAGDKPITPPADLTQAKSADTAAGSATATAEAPAAPAAPETAGQQVATAEPPAAAPAAEPPKVDATAAAPEAPATETPATATAEAPKPASPDAGSMPAAPMASSETPAAGQAPAAEEPAEMANVEPDAAQQPSAPAASEKPADVAKAEPDAAASPPAVAAPAPDAAAPEGKPVVPTFDVVRVEPTGDTVVAGLADPNAKVEVLDGAAAIASAEANERGEWALALDNALTPGTHDLAIRTTSKDKSVSMLSDQRVAVSVPEKGSKDVLVVLNSPDTPSRVLQMDTTKPPAEGPQVATAEPPAGTTPPAASPEKPAAEGPQVATAEAPASGPEKAPATEPPKPDATVSTAPAAASEPSAATPPAATTGPQVAATEAQPEAPAKAEPQVAEKTTESAATAEPAPAAVAEKPVEPAKPVEPPKPAPVVTVAAVEADTAGMLYVSGTASEAGKVRVYLDDQAVGEAEPSPTGIWLVEVHREVPPGTYKVRADQLGDSAGDVQARAEVNFEREIEVASLKASGSVGSSGGADTSGKMPDVQTVMIKRGDNLWRIARAAWGKGIRWSTVYQANKDQIRDPHWIYPGQVLVMPTSPEVAKD